MSPSSSFNTTAIGRSAQGRLEKSEAGPVRVLQKPPPVTLEMLLGADYDAGKVREQIAAHLGRFQHHSTSDVANVALFVSTRMKHQPGAKVPFVQFALAFNKEARRLGKPELPYSVLLRSLARIILHNSTPMLLNFAASISIQHQLIKTPQLT
jgi:hypothetical protein